MVKIKCVYCDSEMTKLKSHNGLAGGIRGYGRSVYLCLPIRDKKTKALDLELETYVCSKCGAVMSKVKDEDLDKLKLNE